MPADPVFRIEVSRPYNPRSQAVLLQLPSLGISHAPQLEMQDLYFLEGSLEPRTLEQLASRLICDPLTDSFRLYRLENGILIPLDQAGTSGASPGTVSGPSVEVLLRPGVTDNVARELLQAAHRTGIRQLRSVATGMRYQFSPGLSKEQLHHLARALLVNDTIQLYALDHIEPQFSHDSPSVPLPDSHDLAQLEDEELAALSAERRLALDLHEMRTIRAFFQSIGRPATDAELETLAQTWSEHCSHKTFRARITCHDGSGQPEQTEHASDPGKKAPLVIDSMLRTYLQSVTEAIEAPWVRSAFSDNAGVIAFDEQFDLSFKVETHNHPSAIEPFGGANTGIGGVVRDVLGVSHRPIANTDVLCFGFPDARHEDLPEGVLHPRRVRSGVVAGIEDYGNKLGLPTVNGAVYYHQGYSANPLVYCGSVGLGLRGGHPRQPQPGDRIIVIGGRTGRDGLRGATFSSLIMDAETSQVSNVAVQIGDPIAEKGLIEVVARACQARLYHAITDCGAGGLSSAVGEMAANLGARVDLALVPLKYLGLAPWEIWLSEAQERMVLAVEPGKVEQLARLCQTYWVEWSDIGEFLDSGQLQVVHGNMPVVDLPNDFLHRGRPQLALHATIAGRSSAHNAGGLQADPLADARTEADLLMALLAHPNIASKEGIIRRYDHQVRGATIIPPLVGVGAHGPSDAAVMKPLETEGWRGYVLANGLKPYLAEHDAYAMAVSAVDEAVRNAVAVGADPEQIGILDNFCWGDPRRPEILGTLVRAVQGCHDAAMHLKTPIISGKDSLNNEYLGNDGQRHAVPGTLLISSISIHPDVRKAISMDLKASGNPVYLVGAWQASLAGSHALYLAGRGFFGDHPALGVVPALPERAPDLYRRLHQAIQAGWVRAAHDLSEGGLATAAAEMALAGSLGLALDVGMVDPQPRLALFAECNGCLLVEVDRNARSDFEQLFHLDDHSNQTHCIGLGEVLDSGQLEIAHRGRNVIHLPVERLLQAFRSQGSQSTSAPEDQTR